MVTFVPYATTCSSLSSFVNGIAHFIAKAYPTSFPFWSLTTTSKPTLFGSYDASKLSFTHWSDGLVQALPLFCFLAPLVVPSDLNLQSYCLSKTWVSWFMLALVFENRASSHASQRIFIATIAYNVNSSLVTRFASNSLGGSIICSMNSFID